MMSKNNPSKQTQSQYRVSGHGFFSESGFSAFCIESSLLKSFLHSWFFWAHLSLGSSTLSLMTHLGYTASTSVYFTIEKWCSWFLVSIARRLVNLGWCAPSPLRRLSERFLCLDFFGKLRNFFQKYLLIKGWRFRGLIYIHEALVQSPELK